MSLRFLDSFNYYSTVTYKYSVSGSPSIASDGSGGVGALTIPAGARARIYRFGSGFGGPYDTWTAGFYLYLNAASYGTGDTALMSLTYDSNPQVTLSVTDTGQAKVLRGGRSGTALGTGSAGDIPLQVWVYVEWQAKIDDTTGTYEVRVGNANKLSGTGADTRDVASVLVRGFDLGNTGNSSGVPFKVAGFHVLDNDSVVSSPTTFLGPTSLITRYPTGDVGTSTWEPSSNRYALIDEASPDGDTTYMSATYRTASPDCLPVHDPDVNPQADFDFQTISLAAGVSVAGVGANVLVRSPQGTGSNNAGSVRPRPDGFERRLGDGSVLLDQMYSTYYYVHGYSSHTTFTGGDLYTESVFNSTDYSVQTVSPNCGVYMYVTQFALDVLTYGTATQHKGQVMVIRPMSGGV